jgi:hypothetical protein
VLLGPTRDAGEQFLLELVGELDAEGVVSVVGKLLADIAGVNPGRLGVGG